MTRIELTKLELSKDSELGLSYESIRNKFDGKSEWINREMKHIKYKYFPNDSLEYLFEEIDET